MTSPPFDSTKKETSCPVMNSSTTTRAPASPNARRSMHSAIATSASSSVGQTIAPLPAASPSVLTTSGAPISRQNRRALPASSKVAKRAVGMLWRRIRSLENALEPSIAAARARGPKTARPAAAKRSVRPATSGASGPITTRSTRSRRAKSTSASCASTPRATHCAWRAIPGLPGAAISVSTSGLWAIFQASACSRPPPPTMRIFMVAGALSPASTEGGLRKARRGSARPALRCAWFDSASVYRAPHARSSTWFDSASWGIWGLDDFEVGSRDAGPGAAGVELEIALPVLDRLAVAAVPGERAREIEVRVGVVRRELEGPSIVGDRFLDRAAILVQGAEVVGGFAALRILIERRHVGFAGLFVATHAMQQQAQVVPRRGVGRIDRDDATVRVDRVLPLAR